MNQKDMIEKSETYDILKNPHRISSRDRNDYK